MPMMTQTLQRAVKHHEAGELDQAEQLYREIIRLDPRQADALHLLGVTAHQRNQNDAAIDYISQAIKLNTSAAMYHSNLGVSYRAAGRIEEAIESFQEAIRIDRTFCGAHYNLAMALEAAGRVTAAITSYWDAIHIDPGFLEAYNNLGRLFSSEKRYEEAITCFNKIVESLPNSSQTYYNLGNAHFGNLQLEEAAEQYRHALRLNPKFSEAHNNLGSVYKELERYDEAVECFHQALELDPDFSDARFNLGTVLKLSGKPDQARECLEVLSSEDCDRGEHLVLLAEGLRKAGQYDEAEDHYRRAIEMNPNLTEAHFGLGFVHLSNGKHELARECFEQTLRIDSEHTAALNNLGSIYSSQDELSKAVDCYERALRIDPDDSANHYNLGNVFKDQWKLHEAEQCYHRAIELNSELTQAFINLGVVLKHQGKLEQAIASHQHAVELAPNDAEARFHYSLALLHNGNFEDGWNEYEWRWQYEATPRDFTQSLWTGTRLCDRKLLVYAEQGVGDEIMFASCLPEIINQTAACFVECDPRLVPLFARSFPLARLIARPVDEQKTDEARPIHFDTQIAMGSVPRYTRRRIEEFPPMRRYLVADKKEVRKWRERFAELGSGLKIGVSWKGGNKPSIRKSRSSPLETWLPVLSTPGVHFVNLQYGETDEELTQLQKQAGVQIHDWDDADPLENLDDFAAQIAALDLVISVDNSTVHMAGALGAPVWTLLPYSPSWRWMSDRGDTLWYSSMKLFRQSEPENWNSVFVAVVNELENLLAQKPQNFEQREFSSIGSTDESQAHIPSENKTMSPRTGDTADAERAAKEKKKYETIWTHDDYRKFSPGLHDADKVPLIDTLRRHNVRTILDAGCGSGKLMQRLMTEHGEEFDVHGFDISENCLDPFFKDIIDDVLTVGCLWNPDDFKKEYDAIICTDVMEHIPTDHVPAVLANFRRCTRKVCYLAVALFPDNFGPALLGEPLHLTVKEPEWWYAQLAIAGFKVDSSAVEKTKEGRDLWLHAFVSIAANAQRQSA